MALDAARCGSWTRMVQTKTTSVPRFPALQLRLRCGEWLNNPWERHPPRRQTLFWWNRTNQRRGLKRSRLSSAFLPVHPTQTASERRSDDAHMRFASEDVRTDGEPIVAVGSDSPSH